VKYINRYHFSWLKSQPEEIIDEAEKVKGMLGTLRGAGISIIGGADIHIFVFCPINFF
jgi:hypothetical protein